MKTIVGVDPDRHYEEALTLLARLAFRSQKLVLAHVHQPVLSPIFVAPEVLQWEDAVLEARLQELGSPYLEAAEKEARARGLGIGMEAVCRPGSKAGVLMDIATDLDADLLAIGSGRKTTLQSVLSGSVGRALAADSHQSFVVARGGTEEQGAVRAVFATDLSAFSDRCLERFLGMGPTGIAQMTVLTASDRDETSSLIGEFGYETGYSTRQADTRAIGTSLGEGMALRIREEGIRSSFVWADGSPSEAIPAAMARDDADLLVLASRGHGLLDRMLNGSLSYREVASAPYSVLVLREPAGGDA